VQLSVIHPAAAHARPSSGGHNIPRELLAHARLPCSSRVAQVCGTVGRGQDLQRRTRLLTPRGSFPGTTILREIYKPYRRGSAPKCAKAGVVIQDGRDESAGNERRNGPSQSQITKTDSCLGGLAVDGPFRALTRDYATPSDRRLPFCTGPAIRSLMSSSTMTTPSILFSSVR
jgi:hypothetical protein